MDRELTFQNTETKGEIIFSDFDQDEEIDVTIFDGEGNKLMYWLNKENLISLKKHIDYLQSKI